MRHALTATSFLLLFVSIAHTQVRELPGWKLVWSDEFNYTGHPDPDKWGYEEGYVRHNELQYYTVNRLENARVDGHNLLVELRKETRQSFLPTSINDEWHRYTSASVNTRNTASWTYGRFEVRAKMPQGKGTWPAIWFLSPLRLPAIPGPPIPRGPDGKEIGAPAGAPDRGESALGEIDLMESWGSRPNRTAVHIHGTKGPTPSKTVPVDDLYGKFHLYSLEWYPDHMDFFLDDTKILTYKKDPAVGWSFDRPMYLIMNIACGGPDESAPDDSKLPQFMTVDYVRVYQKVSGEEGPSTSSTMELIGVLRRSPTGIEPKEIRRIAFFPLACHEKTLLSTSEAGSNSPAHFDAMLPKMAEQLPERFHLTGDATAQIDVHPATCSKLTGADSFKIDHPACPKGMYLSTQNCECVVRHPAPWRLAEASLRDIGVCYEPVAPTRSSESEIERTFAISSRVPLI